MKKYGNILLRLVGAYPILYISVLILPLLAVTSLAGGVYKCKQADGRITYSNIACPEDTLKKEYMGEHTKRQSGGQSGGLRPGELRMLNNYERRLNVQHRADLQPTVRATTRQQSINEHDAKKYYDEAESIRKEAAFRRHMSKSKRKAMEDEAKALERRGDVAAGRRATVAPTELELSREREKAANLRADQSRQHAQNANMNMQHLQDEINRINQQQNLREIERNIWR